MAKYLFIISGSATAVSVIVRDDLEDAGDSFNATAHLTLDGVWEVSLSDSYTGTKIVQVFVDDVSKGLYSTRMPESGESVWVGDLSPSQAIVTPILGEVAPRVFSFRHTAYLGEIATNTITAVSLATGAAVAQDLSGIASLSLTITDAAGNMVQQVANGNLIRTADQDGQVGWVNNAAMTSIQRKLKVFLWDDSGPVLVMSGEIQVEYAKYGA